MNVSSKTLLDEWAALAKIENKRMRQNIDGCPFGISPDSLKRGPKPREGTGMRAQIVEMIRAEPGLSGPVIRDRMGMTSKQWQNAREYLQRAGKIVCEWHGKDAVWRVKE